MLTLLLALLQAAPPSGGMSIRRESDPAAICMVMAVIESRKTALAVTAVDRKPSVERDNATATVTYRRARAGKRTVKVSCQMNLETRQVTSVEVAGQQLLTAPQPF